MKKKDKIKKERKRNDCKEESLADNHSFYRFYVTDINDKKKKGRKKKTNNTRINLSCSLLFSSL